MMPQTNRRAHERHALTPMYSAVTVQVIDQFSLTRMIGHAYDVSAGGVRIELDEPLDEGQAVAIHLDLPGLTTPIFAGAEVVWVNDELDDPGPRRMALRFTKFFSSNDQLRLLKQLGCLPRRAA